jgi:hypothetical protein
LEQLNISQLRNLWLRSPDERLAGWREFRIALQSHYSLRANGTDSDDSILRSSLEAVRTWWDQAPTVSVAIDPYRPELWPTIWEIIYQGECCKYSRGLAMAYNIHYMDSDVNVTLNRVHDHTNNDEYMTAVFNDEYTLNTFNNQILTPQSVASLEIRESYDIRLYLERKQY